QNKIYLPNGGHSNVSVVGFEAIETIPLRNNNYSNHSITWLSIPRHLRNNHDGTTNTPTVFDKNNFSNGYNTLKVDYNRIKPDYTDGIVSANWDIYNSWQYTHNLMETINSTRGYKLDIGPNGPNKLTITGPVEDPSTTIQLKGMDGNNWPENWVGYWLYEEQSPFDAIPQSTLDHLFVIKTQDWYCYRDYPLPYSGNSSWICALSIGVSAPRLHYADLVILKSSDDINSFHWLNNVSPSPYEVRDAPQHYQYTEENDYTAYMVEIDTTNPPLEVAAFIGDSCIGATAVLPDDTLILVRGYDKDTTGEVTFEEHYGTKSAPAAFNEYYVKVPGKQAWQQRKINTSERKDHYLISFKTKQNLQPVEDGNQLQITLFPNPARGNVSVQYQTKQQGVSNITLYDITGRKVLEQSARHPAGMHMLQLDTGTLSNGIYLLRLTSGNQTGVQRLIIK
ncbi:MAG: hypothetical protein DRJ09_13420, partial [Bacteroidetes bacterium]